MKPDLSTFEVKDYLNSRGIPFDTEGKNISSRENWIGISCVWCADHSNHLGINLDSKGISCWLCNQKGTVIKLVMRLDNCSMESALETISQFSSRKLRIEQLPAQKQALSSDLNTILTESQVKNELFDLHRQFLISRDFDPDYIFGKYKLQCCGPVGRWNLRLIIPFYQNNRIVTLTTRDVTNKSDQPYVHLPIGESIIPVKNTLYNLETLDDTGIIVESVTDVWRIGDGCVATMGIKFTTAQVRLLLKLKRAFILYDAEDKAQDMAEKLAFMLSTTIPVVETVELESGDPADLSDDDAKQLRKDVFGRVY